MLIRWFPAFWGPIFWLYRKRKIAAHGLVRAYMAIFVMALFGLY